MQDGNYNVSFKLMSIHRVAVLVHSAKSYCYKSSRLLGFHQLKIIHLDLMGYKIVEVCNK